MAYERGTKIYVGGVMPPMTDRDLETAFAPFGRVTEVWVARKPPGFAFVWIEDPRDADEAVRALNDTEISGQKIRVELSNPRTRPKPPRGGPMGGWPPFAPGGFAPFGGQFDPYAPFAMGMPGGAYDPYRSAGAVAGYDRDRYSDRSSSAATDRYRRRSRSRSPPRRRSRSRSPGARR
jgi:RNA recognition motif-containing protein